MSFQVRHVENGEGEAVIFLHGVGGDSDSWAFQLRSFANAYRAIAWDMPGYGNSEPINLRAKNRDQAARLIRIRGRHFVGPVIKELGDEGFEIARIHLGCSTDPFEIRAFEIQMQRIM